MAVALKNHKQHKLYGRLNVNFIREYFLGINNISIFRKDSKANDLPCTCVLSVRFLNHFKVVRGQFSAF